MTKYGRWLRVEVVHTVNRAKQDAGKHAEAINLDNVTRIRPWTLGDKSGTSFAFSDMSEIHTSEPFEEACLRVMVADQDIIGPTPPIPLIKHGDRMYDDQGKVVGGGPYGGRKK